MTYGTQEENMIDLPTHKQGLEHNVTAHSADLEDTTQAYLPHTVADMPLTTEHHRPYVMRIQQPAARVHAVAT